MLCGSGCRFGEVQHLRGSHLGLPTLEEWEKVTAKYNDKKRTPNGIPDMTPLHYALVQPHSDANSKMASILIEAGCDLDQPDTFGLLPVHLAAMQGYDDILKLLNTRMSGEHFKIQFPLNSQIAPPYPGDVGMTPYDMAIFNNNTETAAVLNKLAPPYSD